MAIAEQFAGLQMEQLIGAPLRAAADASVQLAYSTAEFINNVGFDKDGHVRNVAFAYQKRSVNDDGTSNLDEMKVDVPMLAIVPIPNLQVDEVNVLFDMEVKQSERTESSTDMSLNASGTLNMGFVKVSVTGSVSSHSSNTRSSDNSAKYHVDVRAANHGMPEGLARVLDMMAANVAPSLVSTTIKDGNGQDLPEKARLRAEKMKRLQYKISQIEKRLQTAKDGLSNNLNQMRNFAEQQLKLYRGNANQAINGFDPDNDAEKISTAQDNINSVNEIWDSFKQQTESYIQILAKDRDEQNPTSEVEGEKNKAYDMFGLKVFVAEGDNSDYGENEKYYLSISSSRKGAVDMQTQVDIISKELLEAQNEYSAVASRQEE